MTSPFPNLAGSSPYPFPLPSISPFPLGTTPNPLAHNPLSVPPNPFTQPASAQNALGGSSPFNFTGLTPCFQLTLPSLPNTLKASGERKDAKGDPVDDLGQLLGDVEPFFERALGVAREIERLEAGLWAGEGRSEGMELAMGGLSKLELLRFEYNQILQALLQISQTTLLGSLPVPITDALPPARRVDSSAAAEVTLDDLTQWAEGRAGTEFARREATKSSGKAVLDVLKTSTVSR